MLGNRIEQAQDKEHVQDFPLHTGKSQAVRPAKLLGDTMELQEDLIFE